MPDEKDASYNKVRKVLFNEFTLMVAVVGVVLSAVLYVTRTDAATQQDIALLQRNIEVLKTNDLGHVSEKLDAITEQISSSNSRLRDVERKVDRILIILDR